MQTSYRIKENHFIIPQKVKGLREEKHFEPGNHERGNRIFLFKQNRAGYRLSMDEEALCFRSAHTHTTTIVHNIEVVLCGNRMIAEKESLNLKIHSPVILNCSKKICMTLSINCEFNVKLTYTLTFQN